MADGSLFLAARLPGGGGKPVENTRSMSEVILIVDDHKMNRDFLVRRLSKQEKFQTLAAGDGLEALKILRSTPVDLMILDLMMPGMSGGEVLEKIRQTHSMNVLPVIIATADTTREQELAHIAKGANDYIVKPIDFEMLVVKVRRELE